MTTQMYHALSQERGQPINKKLTNKTIGMLSPPQSPYQKLATLAATSKAPVSATTTTTGSTMDKEYTTAKFSNPQSTSPVNSPAIAHSTLSQVPMTLSDDEAADSASTAAAAISAHADADTAEPDHHINHDHTGGPSNESRAQGTTMTTGTAPTQQNNAASLPPSSDNPSSLTPRQFQFDQPRSLTLSNEPLVSGYKIHKHSPKDSMVSSAWTRLQMDPRAYYEQEMAYLQMYGPCDPTRSNFFSFNNQAERRAQPHARSSRAKRLRRTNVPSDAEPAATRGATGSRTTAASRVSNAVSRPSTPRPRSNNNKVHDANLEDLEDFAPSTDLLPNSKALKVEWRGQFMDLSDDPKAKLLHPAELHLAGLLRLPVDLYLDSKKRFFAEKVHRLRDGLAFRRTDAQKACRIDVNKASRLYAAYEKVGWLDDDLYEKYL